MAIVKRTDIGIGELKHQVEIQKFKAGVDEEGFLTEEWTTIAKVRCKVDFDDRLIREYFKEDGIDTGDIKIITIRYLEGITCKDRLIYKGNTYEIYSVYNICEEDRFLRLYARGFIQ